MPDRFPGPWRSCSRLQDLVKSSLQAGLQRALPLRRFGEELSVTILVYFDGYSSWLSWKLSVYLSNYVARSPPSPAQIAMLGPGRALPLPKYSAWASARESLEKAKPDGTIEILLSKGRDGLLEDSVTNFFVVAMNPGVEVQTAALGDGVLPSVIRQLVIEICEEDEISIGEVSGLRIVQPVLRRCHLWVPGNCLELLANCEWTEVWFERIANVTEDIRTHVLRRAFGEGDRVFEFLKP